MSRCPPRNVLEYIIVNNYREVDEIAREIHKWLKEKFVGDDPRRGDVAIAGIVQSLVYTVIKQYFKCMEDIGDREDCMQRLGMFVSDVCEVMVDALVTAVNAWEKGRQDSMVM